MSVENLNNYVKSLISIFDLIDFSGMTEDYINNYLNSRDEKTFDSSWSAAYAELKFLKKDIEKKSLNKLNKANDLIRKKIFIKIIKFTKNSDLAAYISDDFGMILDALVLINDGSSWVFGLFDCYKKHELPSGLIFEISRETLA